MAAWTYLTRDQQIKYAHNIKIGQRKGEAWFNVLVPADQQILRGALPFGQRGDHPARSRIFTRTERLMKFLCNFWGHRWVFGMIVQRDGGDIIWRQCCQEEADVIGCKRCGEAVPYG